MKLSYISIALFILATLISNVCTLIGFQEIECRLIPEKCEKGIITLFLIKLLGPEFGILITFIANCLLIIAHYFVFKFLKFNDFEIGISFLPLSFSRVVIAINDFTNVFKISLLPKTFYENVLTIYTILFAAAYVIATIYIIKKFKNEKHV